MMMTRRVGRRKRLRLPLPVMNRMSDALQLARQAVAVPPGKWYHSLVQACRRDCSIAGTSDSPEPPGPIEAARTGARRPAGRAPSWIASVNTTPEIHDFGNRVHHCQPPSLSTVRSACSLLSRSAAIVRPQRCPPVTAGALSAATPPRRPPQPLRTAVVVCGRPSPSHRAVRPRVARCPPPSCRGGLFRCRRW